MVLFFASLVVDVEDLHSLSVASSLSLLDQLLGNCQSLDDSLSRCHCFVVRCSADSAVCFVVVLFLFLLRRCGFLCHRGWGLVGWGFVCLVLHHSGFGFRV